MTFKKISFLILPFTFCIACFMGCEETTYTPKPRGYPRFVLPEKAYQKFDAKYCNFVFDYPKYATIEQEKNFFDEKN